MPARALIVGVLSGAATFLAYLPGTNQAFGWDASVTVALFIRAPLRDAVFSQYATNNHPYFSLAEQLVSRATGSSSELTLRLLPITLAALTVAVVATVVARRLGIVPALAGAVVLASNPLFLSLARDVRGYSLLTFCAVISTLAVVDRRDGAGRWRWLYVVAVGVGLGTHLFMVWVVLAHVVIVFLRRQPRDEWLFRWVAAVMIGAVPYVLHLGNFLHQAGSAGPTASFPAVVVRDVLGAPVLRAVIVGATVLVGVWLVRRHALTMPLAVVGALALGAAWATAPAGASRFFDWVTPATALAAASAVSWRRWLVAPLALGVVASCVFVSHDYTSDSLINRTAAPYVAAAYRAHAHPCGLGGSAETLPAYTGDIPQIFDARVAVQCDLVVVVDPRVTPALVATVRPAFPHALHLHATTSGFVLYRDPSIVAAAR